MPKPIELKRQAMWKGSLLLRTSLRGHSQVAPSSSLRHFEPRLSLRYCVRFLMPFLWTLVFESTQKPNLPPMNIRLQTLESRLFEMQRWILISMSDVNVNAMSWTTLRPCPLNLVESFSVYAIYFPSLVYTSLRLQTASWSTSSLSLC